MSKVAAETATKLFIGPRFRRIRRQLGLSQTQMADALGVSPSYINLIERNQRPVTAQILLKMAEAYDIDLRDLAGRDETASFEANPVERVRDLIEANRNHFPALETTAERLRDELDAPSHELFRALCERLRQRHGVLVRTLPVDVMRDTLRRYVHHRRQLLLSELLDAAGR